MDNWLIVLLIVLGVILVGMIVLYFLGKKLQKKQEASEQQMQAGAQTTSLFVIKKDRVRLRDAGFPQIVIDQTPKLLRRSKIPTVKAKVGPRIITFMCDEKAFSVIPEKREVKCVINGIYIMEAKWARGGLLVPEGKKTLRQRLAEKLSSKKKEDSSPKKKGQEKGSDKKNAGDNNTSDKKSKSK